MTTRPVVPEAQAVESLAEGGTWLLDLVAAVDHLRRGIRPRITVWDAIEEALRWHTPSTGGHDPAEPDWDDPDPLRSALTRFLDHTTGPTSGDAQVALRRWIVAMAARYNDGRHWPHPASRRPFPPPLLAADLFNDPIN